MVGAWAEEERGWCSEEEGDVSRGVWGGFEGRSAGGIEELRIRSVFLLLQ